MACFTFGKLEIRTLKPNRFKNQSSEHETTWSQLQPSTLQTLWTGAGSGLLI